MANSENASIYKPLETPTTIRLLRIHRENGSLRYSISHQQLEHMPPYVALSYTWVADKSKAYLFIGGIDFQVPGNVKSLLHRFSDCVGACRKETIRNMNDTLDVWIDQVCIDQSNAREREGQVKLMERVYSKASYVVADLGPHQPLDELLILLLMEERFDWKQTKARIERSGGREAALITITNVQKALEQFLHRRYFTRAWILQEFVLNSRTYLLLGNFTSSVDRFCDNASIGILQMTGLEHNELTTYWFESISLDTFRALAKVAFLRTLRNTLHWNNAESIVRKQKFSNIVKQACQLEATIEHDKIYGCLALADEAFREDFKIDYNESLAGLSHRLVRALINHERSVSILYQAICVINDKAWSSWALETSPTQKSSMMAETMYEVEGNPQFDASAGTSQPPIPISVSKILLVRGHVIDQVGALTPGLKSYSSTYRMIKSYYGLIHRAKSPDWTWNADAFWRTIVQGKIFPNEFENEVLRARPHHVTYYLCWLCVMQEKTRLLYDEALRQVVKRLAGIFEDSLTTFLSGRRLCLTVERRIASVAENSTADDKIVILQGGNVPFVMRPAGECLYLVGKCYVHGIMDGEAMRYVGEATQLALI